MTRTRVSVAGSPDGHFARRTLASSRALALDTILGRLGARAMGEVHRAKDSRLGREVAIQVLPAHFADDAERLKRFEREAKTPASCRRIADTKSVEATQISERGSKRCSRRPRPSASSRRRPNRRPRARHGHAPGRRTLRAGATPAPATC